MKASKTADQSFEATYPQYPFAELVRLSMVFARALRSVLDRRQTAVAPRRHVPAGPAHSIGAAGAH